MIPISGDASGHHPGYTNAEGEVVLDGASSPGIELNGTVEIKPADGSGYAVQSAPIDVHSRTNTTVVVEEQVTVSGRIVDENQTGLTDSFVLVGNNDSFYFTRTNSTGWYELGVPQNDTYQISVIQRNGTQDIDLPRDGVTDIYEADNLTVDSSDINTGTYTVPDSQGILGVRVVNESGDPVEGANVSIFGDQDGGLRGGGWLEWTNEDGYYTAGGHRGVEAAGDYNVRVKPPENSDQYVAKTYWKNLTVTNDTDLVFTLNESNMSPSTVNGWVQAEDGTTPEGVVTLKSRLGAPGSDESTLGSDGRYSLTADDEGTYQVSFRQPNGNIDNVPDLYPLHRVYTNDPQSLGNDVLPSANRLNVTVVDSDGSPVSDVHVNVFYGGNRVFDYISGTTTQAGELAIGDTYGVEVAGPNAVPNDYGGNVHVQAYGPNDTFAGSRLTVTNDTDITIELRNRTDVTGTFIRPDSQPAVNRTAVVLGDTNGTTGGAIVRTDDAGNFTASVAQNGTYNVKFRQERYDTAGKSFPRDGVPDVYAVTQRDVGTSPEDVGTISLPTASLLNVSVVDSNGTSVENARVTIDHRNDGSVAFVSGNTLANGTMILDATGKPGVELSGDLRLTVEAPPNSTTLEGAVTTETLTLTDDRNVTVQLNTNETNNTTVDGVDVTAVAPTTSAGVGDTVTVDLVAQNVTDSVGAFEATLSLTNDSVGTIQDVSVLGSPNTSAVDYGANNSTVSVDAFGMNTAQTGDVVLARVNVTLDAAGDTDVNVSNTVLATADGNDITVTSETGTTLTATNLSPVAGATNPPSDIDGDGSFEDINGDGNVTVSDVQAMFANRDDPVLEDNVDEFDFTGNGEVNIVDVQQLFVEVSS
ncbi:hypothetical protein AUR66_14910 [Haloferax profundi]|uniref:Dockerin domain-containing protein n=1 Tax=Haloferax profundi TaxID=1544718 RepID=A0A0W1SLF1_9EURY|nr:hypothetical protein AUR66_14910 [Haloferax profundi]